MLSFDVMLCYTMRQLSQRAALRSVYLNDLLGLLRRSGWANIDVYVDVVASVHHVGIHGGGSIGVVGGMGGKRAGWCCWRLA
jgi:hypothetical protein